MVLARSDWSILKLRPFDAALATPLGSLIAAGNNRHNGRYKSFAHHQYSFVEYAQYVMLKCQAPLAPTLLPHQNIYPAFRLL